MTDRSDLIQSFICDLGWSGAEQTPLASDCSNRKYIRLENGPDGTCAMLMDAPPEKGEDTRPFIKIADHLLDIGLSAPRIFARDETNGILLIEDLGHDIYAPIVELDPSLEEPLYIAATDALIALHSAPLPKDVPDYGSSTMIQTAELGLNWYVKGANDSVEEDLRAALNSALTESFSKITSTRPVLVLRDYHAENLLWLPERRGVARVGQLDFQDAATGLPAYDLMSLGRDVRRDVRPDLSALMLDHYAAETGFDRDALDLMAALCSAQRNLRVLGVFARMSMHFARPAYIDLLSRTWDNLMIDLSHPELGALRDTVTKTFPTPTQDVLKKLKAKCGTIPTLS